MTTALTFRFARMDDLPVLIDLLADDKLGQTRENLGENIAARYKAAMETIIADARNDLIIACQEELIAGVLQLTFIPGLTYTGGMRAQIEGVRVAGSMRGKGVGTAMVNQAIDLARKKGCVLVQLTTDKRRPEALKFYEAAGFSSSHAGMKLWL